jgi:hypothetical protein
MKTIHRKKARSDGKSRKRVIERKNPQFLNVKNRIYIDQQYFIYIIVKFPDLTDEVAVQKFFMTEISLGEQLLGVGDIENGIEHLANAVAVTSHKENLLNVLRTTLPDPIFSLLVQKLPEVSRVSGLSMAKKAC